MGGMGPFYCFALVRIVVVVKGCRSNTIKRATIIICMPVLIASAGMRDKKLPFECSELPKDPGCRDHGLKTLISPQCTQNAQQLTANV